MTRINVKNAWMAAAGYAAKDRMSSAVPASVVIRSGLKRLKIQSIGLVVIVTMTLVGAPEFPR